MKKHKYRVFAKERGRIETVVRLDFIRSGKFEGEVKAIRTKHWNYEDVHGREEDFILLQFTGITDKNGRDIYEGDILKWDEKEWGDPYNEVVETDAETWRENDWPEFVHIVGSIYEDEEYVGDGEEGEHPDVVRLKSEIKSIEEKIALMVDEGRRTDKIFCLGMLQAYRDELEQLTAPDRQR